MIIEDFFSILFQGIYTEKVLKDWERPVKNNVFGGSVLSWEIEKSWISCKLMGGRVAI